MTIKEIRDLIRLIDQTNLTEFKLKEGDFELSIRTKDFQKGKTPTFVQHQPAMVPVQSVQTPGASMANASDAIEAGEASKPSSVQGDLPSAPAPAGNEENLVAIKSPIVGTFYRSSAPEKPAYIKVGDVIAAGDVVCIVEAMKLFNEIESEVAGKVVKVLIDDASPVEFDQVLFLVDPKG